MTREEAKKLLPIIEAYSEGEDIQYYDSGLEQWFNCSNPDFYTENEYRIKQPEPKYRPFNSKEECWNEMLKHEPFGWVEDSRGLYKNITKVFPNSIEAGYNYTYEEAMQCYKFTDGTPFGIMEEGIHRK